MAETLRPVPNDSIFDDTYTEYMDSRAIVLDKVLRNERTVADFRKLDKRPYDMDFQSEIWPQQQATLRIDDRFQLGMNKIAFSLWLDLRETGKLGQDMARDIVYDVQHDPNRK